MEVMRRFAEEFFVELENGVVMPEKRYNKIKYILETPLYLKNKSKQDITFAWIKVRYENLPIHRRNPYAIVEEEIAVGLINSPEATLFSNKPIKEIKLYPHETERDEIFCDPNVICYWGEINEETGEEGWIYAPGEKAPE